MKVKNKLFDLANIDDKSLFLKSFRAIDKSNEDFNSVYEWFMNSNYLDLGDPKFEDALNKLRQALSNKEEFIKRVKKVVKTV